MYLFRFFNFSIPKIHNSFSRFFLLSNYGATVTPCIVLLGCRRQKCILGNTAEIRLVLHISFVGSVPQQKQRVNTQKSAWWKRTKIECEKKNEIIEWEALVQHALLVCMFV